MAKGVPSFSLLPTEVSAMTDDIPSRDDGFSGKCPTCGQPYLEAEIRRLRARIAELEAAGAITLGTLEPPTDDEPARYTHHVPPSAPPHNE
jgi:hypothetical protein